MGRRKIHQINIVTTALTQLRSSYRITIFRDLYIDENNFPTDRGH